MFDRSTWSNKSKVSSNLSQIKAPLAEIRGNENSRFQENITNILVFFFGKYQSPGALAKFTEQKKDYMPTQWIEQMEMLLSNIDSDSDIFSRIHSQRQCRIILNNSFLPAFIDPPTIQRYTRILQIKSAYQGISLPVLDAYFLMLARAIYDSSYYNSDNTQYEYLQIDNLYSSLTRNCLLVLLRRLIDNFKKRSLKLQLSKLIGAIKLFFMDELVAKYEKQRMMNRNSNARMDFGIDLSFEVPDVGKKSIKYRLKTHHLQMFMLFFKYPDVGHQFADFQKYMVAVVYYFRCLNPDILCLSAFIRLWIFYLINHHHNNVQHKILNVLHKASKQDGCFYLSRYKSQQIFYNQHLSSTHTAIVHGIVNLLGKDQYWAPNTLYIFTLACFLNLLNSCQMYFEDSDLNRASKRFGEQSHEFRCLKESLRLINTNMIDILAVMKKTDPNKILQSKQLLQQNISAIQRYFNNLVKSINKNQGYSSRTIKDLNQLPEFNFKKVDMEEIQMKSKTQKRNISSSDLYRNVNNQQNDSVIDSKRKLISFYRRQNRGCWEIPIQYNQSIILYYICFTIAKMFDFLIPGKRPSPILNIRFLANPITFGICIIFFIIVYWLLWK